jgi:penicillin-binding protein 1C
MRWLKRLAAGPALAVMIISIALYVAVSPRAYLQAPQPTVLLLDRQGRYLADVGDGGGELGYWPLARAPERVAQATIAVEDQRFWSHPGVDVFAILRALRQNSTQDRRISGASTLAMQIARMQQPGERNYKNKLLEAATALLLTWRYDHQKILAHYLRIAPYSNRIHGIANAAERYFRKDVEDLSWAEIAFLAAIPQSPSRMNPHEWRGWARARKRAGHILTLLHERGVTEKEEHALALAQLERISVNAKPQREPQTLHAILRIEELLSRAAAHPGGRTLTTLDLDIQESALAAAEATLQQARAEGAENAAVLVVDRATRGVLAYVGSTGYFQDAGAIDYARTPRAAGSTLKPFIYAAALDRAVITPATVLDDLSRGPDGIANMDGNYLGPILPRVALATSRNVPAAHLLEALGLERGYQLLAELGLHHHEHQARHYGAGLALGALPVKLEDLAAAYLSLGDGSTGQLSYWPGSSKSRRIFSESSARQITRFLSDPVARLPIFPRLGPLEYDFPAAVKTGTSQGYRDAWTVAYTEKILVAAWIGRADAQPMNQLSGASSAAKLVRRILLPLHQSQAGGLSDLSFAAPRDTKAVRLCALSGKMAHAACDHSFIEYLPAPEALESCDVHLSLAVDARSGKIAAGDVPAELIERRTYVELEPKYARWAEEQYFVSAPARSRAISETMAPPVIVKPENGARILIDPETPPDSATLALETRVDRSVEQIVWYVDGKPFELQSAPFSTRWPLVRGTHVIEARVPFTPHRSAPVRITVE